MLLYGRRCRVPCHAGPTAAVFAGCRVVMGRDVQTSGSAAPLGSRRLRVHQLGRQGELGISGRDPAVSDDQAARHGYAGRA
jgi:hypothetical protein